MLTDHCDFLPVTILVIRCFQDEGAVLQKRMRHDTQQRVFSNHTEADFFMAVLVGSDWIFAVIQMDSLQSVQTD